MKGIKLKVADKVYNLEKVIIKIGRNPDSDIVINDATVSKEHAFIEVSDGSIYITDFESLNGVKINGNKIICRTEIFRGQEVHIGDVPLDILEGGRELPELHRKAQRPGLDIIKGKKVEHDFHSSEYAGFFKRAIARTIDVFILMIIALILILALGDKGTFNRMLIAAKNPINIYSVYHSVIASFYFGICHSKWGMTIGKKMTGIMLVRIKNNRYPGFFRAAFRELVTLSLTLVPFKLGIIADLLFFFINPKRRTIHDICAGTIVVRRK
jgi:uncharacterized RDD family membrane protein YckC